MSLRRGAMVGSSFVVRVGRASMVLPNTSRRERASRLPDQSNGHVVGQKRDPRRRWRSLSARRRDRRVFVGAEVWRAAIGFGGLRALHFE